METVMDRAVLDAFVDGALAPEEAARVVVHLADCPADAAYVDALMEISALLSEAYAAPLNEAVPDRLRETIFPASGVVAGGPRRARRVWITALAACALLAIGAGLSGFWSNPGDANAALLAQALETSPSGPVATEPSDPRITLIGTFHDKTGRPCREFEMLDQPAAVMTRGIACRDAEHRWMTEIAVTSRLPAESDQIRDAFVPAEGADAAALDPTLDRLGAGMTLGPAEERALIEGGWSP